MSAKLVLEKRDTPSPGEFYPWLWRVQVSSDQAVVGIPAFRTVGIAFENESDDDFDVHAPYHMGAEAVFKHIRANKGAVSARRCVKAIQMIIDAVAATRGRF